MTKPLVITGLQWGDEGKGKLTDFLSRDYDVTVRFNGGHNAGHTVKVGNQVLHLSLLPSSLLNQKKILIAQGVVIDPRVLITEINHAQLLGLKLDLGIDPRCHLVLPYHQALDAASENFKGKAKTGSLKLGIGFCYEDRTNRHGIRLIDLVSPDRFVKLITANWPLKELRVTKTYQQRFDLDRQTIIREYLELGRKLKPFLLPVSEYVLENRHRQRFLFESAQGFYLDFVFGSYPYTVGYHTLASSSLPDIGLPGMAIRVLGLVKAYTTRVGNGPFPTELLDQTGEYLQNRGREVGTVSGRKRRCGWLDLNLIRYANLLSGTTSLALTKLDVLTGLSTIKVAVAYQYQHQRLTLPPIDQDQWHQLQPIYRNFPGWKSDISNCQQFNQLPKAAQTYIRFIAKNVGVKIKYVSVGPDRSQTIKMGAKYDA